jgi:hypothetical protein
MPTIKKLTVFTGNDEFNPLAGSQYEFLPFDALIQAAIRCDTGDVVVATMHSGTDLLLESSPVDEKALALPIVFPDDYDVQDVAAAGERIGLTLRETAGAAANVRTVVRITPL